MSVQVVYAYNSLLDLRYFHFLLSLCPISSIVLAFLRWRMSSSRTSCSSISLSSALRISFMRVAFSSAKASLMILSRRAFTLRVDFGSPSKSSFGS